MNYIGNLNVIYEDNHIIVVQKYENVLSQKDITNDIDMLTIVKGYIKQKYNKPNEVYLGLVHRLDRRVGGLMVFAKTSKAAARLSLEIRERNISKKYLAIVLGKTKEYNYLEDYIIKEDKVSRIVDSEYPNSQKAVLEYHTLQYFTFDDIDFSLIEVNLLTGRYNQIRSQLSCHSNPIINDFKYGYRGKNYNDQLGLWCYELSFKHPTKKEKMNFSLKPTTGIWSGKL